MKLTLVRLLAPLFAVAFWAGGAAANAPLRPAAAQVDPSVVAQVLAGIAPAPGDARIDGLVASSAWREHRNWLQARWADVQLRLSSMSRWRQSSLALPDGARRTLVYAFSGPDFLNAYTMFPDHPHYVFFSLERPGSLPDLTALGEQQWERVLGDVRNALQDIFERNYFITDYMTRQLSTQYVSGTVPVMAVMMALTGHRVVSIESIDPFPELTREYSNADARSRPNKLLRAVRITYTRAGDAADRPRTLEYYSLDATDRALRWYPDFVDHVGRRQPATAFLKSASYLLHDEQFARTREMLLKRTDVVVQDDTGIPYRHLTSAGWDVQLFGMYTKPIKPLSYGKQPDLEVAFKTAGNVPQLDFPFGYRGKGGRSILLLARRDR
jgi:hypothetical protein